MYDVSNAMSFMNLHQWVIDLKKHELDKEEVFIVGNKIDLVREVSTAEGKEFAMSYGMKFFETSAKTGENIKTVVQLMLCNIKDAHDSFSTGTGYTGVINNQECDLQDDDAVADQLLHDVSVVKEKKSRFSCPGCCCSCISGK